MKNKKGFTLIEAAAAAAVISSILISICNLYIRNINIYKMSEEKDTAFNIARTVCEIYKSESKNINNEFTALYVNDIEEIPTDLNMLVNKSTSISKDDIDTVINLNFQNKSYGVIVKEFKGIDFKGIRVKVISIKYKQILVCLDTIKLL